MKIQIINGPNLNLLGTREPEIYGSLQLEDIIALTEKCVGNSAELTWFQSNLEGEIVNKIQELVGSDCEGLVINPAGYSHTSVAIRDALAMLQIPVVEVHLSNVQGREQFRHTMLTGEVADSIMEGFGAQSYYLAVHALINKKNF